MSFLSFFSILAALLTACGGTGTGNPKTDTSGNLALQSAPLAGPNAAFNLYQKLEDRLFSFFGLSSAFATVSSFSLFKACNDTLTFLDTNGSQITVNGSSTPSVGQGLLTFSPTGTTAMSIGSLNIPSGTVLSEIDITFAVVPTVCSGVAYAVQFDPGSGPINITQNTAFKFKFNSNYTITGNAQTVNLQFGTIVNAMVNLGTGLNDSTIQTINVGQAQ